MSSLVVMGAGAWGTALAELARRAGHDVALWSRRAPGGIDPARADALIVAVPAQDVRAVLQTLALPPQVPLIITAKGIERDSGKLMHEVAAEAQPQQPIYLLSGPSFAADVSAGLPTAVTMAGDDIDACLGWAGRLSLPHFRIYGSSDLTGVAIGGAMKNVLAIACGIADGRGFGDSARAALVTRGFAELARFGAAMGARPDTLMGLSGMGDLLLTATSAKSRNMRFGRHIGEGMSVPQALAATGGTVEGVYTAAIAARISTARGIAMPIVMAVHAIVDGGSNPDAEIQRLLARPAGPETN